MNPFDNQPDDLDRIRRQMESDLALFRWAWGLENGPVLEEWPTDPTMPLYPAMKVVLKQERQLPPGPVKPFDTAAEADDFHADIAAWMEQQGGVT